MGESTHEIEQDIVTERNELGRNLHVLETKARSLADWRNYYRNYPFAMIGLALGGGLLLGAMTGDRGARADQGGIFEEPGTDYPSSRFSSPSATRIRRQFGDTWDHIADALLGVATAKAIDYVSQIVPGFREQFAARHPEHRTMYSAGTRNA
jgi:hypothetical protein